MDSRQGAVEIGIVASEACKCIMQAYFNAPWACNEPFSYSLALESRIYPIVREEIWLVKIMDARDMLLRDETAHLVKVQ